MLIAFGTLIVQIIFIVILMVTFGSIRKFFLKMFQELSRNQTVFTTISLLALFLFVSFVMSVKDSLSFTEQKAHLPDQSFGTYSKIDIDKRIFYFQRNMYLLGMVNFNWIVLYGIKNLTQKYEQSKTNLEETKQKLALAQRKLQELEEVKPNASTNVAKHIAVNTKIDEADRTSKQKSPIQDSKKDQ